MPTNFTPRLKVNFSNPDAKPLSTITASVLKAALATPAQNLPLPFSMAPMILMTGVIQVYLNFSSMSLTGRFFLQMLLILISFASLPPGKRKSYGFHNYYLLLLTLTNEFLRRYSRRSSSLRGGEGLGSSSFDSIFSAEWAGDSSSLAALTGLSSSLISETE